MSYNIDNWKTKRIEGLAIPIAAIYDQSEDEKRRGWGIAPMRLPDPKRFTATIDLPAEDSEITGTLDPTGETLRVTTIKVRGEGSGHCLEEVLYPILKRSTGILEAVLIWEGGDSVTRLVVRDGVITSTPVEL